MYKKIGLAAAGLLLAASPLIVSAQEVALPTIPQNASLQQLEALIVQLTQILNSLLAQHSTSPTITFQVKDAYALGAQFAWPISYTNAPSDANLCLTLVQSGQSDQLGTGVQAFGNQGCYAVSGTGVQNFSGVLSSSNAAPVPPGQYFLHAVLVQSAYASSNGTVYAQANSPTFTVSTSTQGSRGTLAVSAAQQPLNTIAPEGAIVPMTKFTLTNTGSNPITIGDLMVEATNPAAAGAVQQIEISWDGEKGVSSNGGFATDVATTISTSPLTIQPGGSKLITISADMKTDLSAYAGDLLGVKLVGIATDATVSGGLPIGGAVDTINSTLNVCNPPQTAVYGYQCWANTSPPNSSSSLVVSTDPSSPPYAVTSGGTTGVVLGVADLNLSGTAPVLLEKLGLKLSSGNPQDLKNVTLWTGGTQQVGAVSFASGNSATTTLSNLSLSSSNPGSETTPIVIRGNINPIGVGEPGVSGDLIQVNVSGAQGVGADTIVNSVGTSNVAGVRIFKSYPTVALVPLDTSVPGGIASINGNLIALMRFAITASPAGPVGIERMDFGEQMNASGNVTNMSLYGYTSSGYTQAIPGQATNGQIGGTTAASNSAYASFVPSSVVEIPAGATYYFQLVGAVPQGATTITTTMLGDASYAGLSSLSANSGIAGSHMWWSPNDSGTSASNSSDWTNGYGVPGLPAGGISQIRTGGSNPPSPTTPTATIDQSSLTSTSGTPTITGTASGVVSTVYVVVSANNQAGASQGAVPVTNGRWSALIYPKGETAFPPGTYQVTVYNGLNNGLSGPSLTAGTLTIESNTTPTASITAAYGNTQSSNGALTVPIGTTASIQWTSSGEGSCSVASNPGGAGGETGQSGNFTFTMPQVTTVFTLTCTDAERQSATDTVTLHPTAATTPPTSTVSDSQIKTDLADIAAGLEKYWTKHHTYTVSGGGYTGGGMGYATYENGSDYKTATTRVLYNDSDMSRLIVSPSETYMLYTCDNGQSYALSAKLASPSSADIANIQSSCNGTGANGTYTVYKKNYAVTGSHVQVCKVTNVYSQAAPGMATASNFFLTVQDLPLNANVTGITGAGTWDSLTFHVQDREGSTATLEADQTVNSTGISYLMAHESTIHPSTIGGSPITCQSESGSTASSADTSAQLANVLTSMKSILIGLQNLIDGM